MLIGGGLFLLPILSKLFFLLMFLYFFKEIVTSSNRERSFKIAKACFYVVGAEVLFRMTKGGLTYESSKYLVIIYVVLGMFYNGLSGKGVIYLVFLLLLVPSVIVAIINVDYETNIRKSILFVLSGPLCLGISALYFYDKKITLKKSIELLTYLSFPIVSMTVYLFLYTPSIKDVLKGTASNFAASGGFGPNQVATILGLGIFAFTIRLLIFSKTSLLKIVNGVILLAIAFRGIVTFSRGGIFAAIMMIILFLLTFYFRATVNKRKEIILSIVFLAIIGSVTWIISSNQTMGLIDKRYANQDASGREKSDVTTGRVDLIDKELEGFIKNPFLGLGANGSKKIRADGGKQQIASHNEISRLLSEHGIFGVFILLILIVTPLAYRAQNRRNILFYPFLIFWFATINHSAMRIAAPGFIYALSLINIQNEKRPLHRKRIVK